MTVTAPRATTVRRGRVLIVGALFFPALVSACGSDSVPESDTDPTSGLANPASVYCEEQGGTVEIERDAEGNETGICVLPDGTRVDEWEFYRDQTE